MEAGRFVPRASLFLKTTGHLPTKGPTLGVFYDIQHGSSRLEGVL
jgi:hypothetical protein